MDAPAQLRSWRGDLSLVKASRLIDCDPSYLFLLENHRRRPRKKIRETIKRVVGTPETMWDKVVIHAAQVRQSTTPVNDDSRKRASRKPAKAKTKRARSGATG